MAVKIDEIIQSVTPSTKTNSVSPLATLEDNATASDTLMYPSDLGSDARNHYVQIYIKNIIPSSYGTSQLNPTTNISGGLNFDPVSQIVNAITKPFSFPSLNFNFNLNFDPPVTNTVAVISLYMPDTLASTYNATYDSLSLTGDLGNTIKGIQAVASGAGAMNDDTINGNPSSVSPATITLLQSVLGSKALSVGIDLQNIGDLLIKGAGFGINPQLQMLYRGTKFRSFQLSFMFSPKTEDEAETVNKIINTLRYHFSPTMAVGGGSSNDSMFLIPPSLFNIKFKLNSNENKFLPKYGDCVLENIDIDNAPNGFAAYDSGPKGLGSGAPVQTRLTLQFKEIVVVDRALIKEGSVR